MKTAECRGESIDRKSRKALYRASLVLWLMQALVLALVASRLMFPDGDWVQQFEQYRVVRGFMANPVEMTAVRSSTIMPRGGRKGQGNG
jgi:hypothetical protein